MTFTIDTASTPPDQHGQVPFAPGHEVEPRRRGRTTVTRGVVESIIGRLATEVPGVAAAQLSGIRGWLATSDPDRADAQVSGGPDGLHVGIDIAVEIARPVVDVVGELRRRVIEVVDHRLDLRVAEVDVRIVELRRAPAPVTIDRKVR